MCQAKLWDWDNLDPDSLMPGGVGDTATSNNPTAGLMSSNLNSNMPMSQADDEEKQTANKNWGFAPADTPPSGHPSGPAMSSAQRPHTAHGGRVEGSGNDDGHVVAGARAMMKYRRTKENTPTTSGGGASTSRSWGQSTGNRCAASAFDVL